MDKVKKYLSDNEEHLSVEQISDKVWANVEKATVTKRNFFARMLNYLSDSKNKFRKHLSANHTNSLENYKQLKLTYNFKWALAIVLPMLFIFSCTYRIDRVEAIGDIVSFDINKDNISALKTISLLQNSYRLAFLNYQNPKNPDPLSFLGYINREKEKSEEIKKDLKKVPGINHFEVTPVIEKVNESLLSVFVHKTFNVHLDARKQNKTELEKKIVSQLREKGLNDVDVKIAGGQVQLTSQETNTALDFADKMRDAGNATGDELNTVSSKQLAAERDTAAVAIRSIASEDTMPKKHDWQALNPPIPRGGWKAFIAGSLLFIHIRHPNPDSERSNEWAVIRKFTTSEAGLRNPQKDLEFAIKKEAGTVSFNGLFQANRGQGTYQFHKNPAFKAYLEQNGFNTDGDLMLSLSLSDMGKDDVEYVKKKWPNITSEQLRRLATLFIPLEYLKKWETFFRQYNYKDVTVEQLFKAHRVTVSVLAEIIEMGYKVNLDDAEDLIIHGVSPQFLRNLVELGYQDIPLKAAVSLKINKVTPSFIKGFQELGFTDVPLEKFQLLKTAGITPEFIQQMRKEGKVNLTLDEYVKLKQ